MLQLKILSGKRAGEIHTFSILPAFVGRSSSSTLRIEEPGVWDQHLQICFSNEKIQFATQEGATTLQNGNPVPVGTLRNGDLLEIGSCKLSIWLSPPPQKKLLLRELATWGVVFGVTALEIFLILALSR
ncbi:MAG: FHA domain-containing protein [Verrucomicrobiota bacterium]|nr:FHA domain-containing protein [Verrucomicrobiota bacterium]